WFVGFAADDENVSSENIKLAILVFLRRAHGAEAAAVSRPVFDAYARVVNQTVPGETPSEVGAQMPPPADAGVRALPATTADRTIVRVRAVSRDVTIPLPLEQYVREVLATEASTEDEFEALKAQSIATRTYALKNLGRHSAEGYDFCSTTHCQRFALPAAGKDRRADVERAVGETAGLILRDERNEPIESFFHASCGGMTANIKTLWGGGNPAPAYLSGVRDDYCLTMPHARWVDRIVAADLLKALASDSRSDVGRHLTDVRVTRRDRTGRAEAVLLEGERTRTLSGWDLKMIVGRTLGWNLLKSSRYEVTRSGETFIFRGGGFGHGLGLCQEGAHVMARRGADAQSILAHYFPGTKISTFAPAPEEKNKTRVMRDLLLSPPDGVPPLSANAPAGRQTIQSSEHFRLVSREAGSEKLSEKALEILEAARRSLERRAGGSAKKVWPRVEVIIYGSTSQFVDATGQPGWVGGVARGNRLQLQPLALLARRGLLETTLRHEYAHTVIETMSRGRAPRWLAEGLAAHVAGEGRMLANRRAREIGREDLERALERPSSREEMFELYAAAYREVRALIRAEGEENLWRDLSRY
ncbi:MAG TPA: SpoIID/LytB domain-containing protein, partial [Pyrinomonadaceae bacterium]|nr:SpoIID/LytB domain-containing protein [Pyrinomonadaceae bacterium]